METPLNDISLVVCKRESCDACPAADGFYEALEEAAMEYGHVVQMSDDCIHCRLQVFSSGERRALAEFADDTFGDRKLIGDVGTLGERIVEIIEEYRDPT